MRFSFVYTVLFLCIESCRSTENVQQILTKIGTFSPNVVAKLKQQEGGDFAPSNVQMIVEREGKVPLFYASSQVFFKIPYVDFAMSLEHFVSLMEIESPEAEKLTAFQNVRDAFFDGTTNLENLTYRGVHEVAIKGTNKRGVTLTAQRKKKE